MLSLKPGDRVRIYTWIADEDKQRVVRSANDEIAAVAARCGDKSHPRHGLYHATAGDRIVLIDREGKILLDINYWPLEAVHEETQHGKRKCSD